MDQPPNQRPPLTVWRFVTVELWRLLLLTAWVFVSVVAFAATVKPLADGKLGILDALMFMTLAMPPMLAYALPFASGFAATLAYHRMAQDNETIACHAGGVSHRGLLAPAAISGLVLAVLLFILSNSIIPRFLRSMEELITVDATRLLMNTINRGDPVHIGDTHVHADLVRPMRVPEESDASQLLYLKGLLIVGVDDDGGIRSEISAREAFAFVRRSEPSSGGAGDGAGRTSETVVSIQLVDYAANIERARGGFAGDWFHLRVPNAFSDDPKFLTWSELSELRRYPARMNWVDDRRRNLASRLAQRAVIEAMDADLASTGSVRLVSAREDASEVFVIHAAGLGPYELDAGHRLVAPSGEERSFRIERTTPNGVQTLLARQAWLDASPAPEMAAHPVQIRLTLSEYAVEGDSPRQQGDAAMLLSREEFRSLVQETDPAPAIFMLNTDELLARADARIDAQPGDVFVDDARNELRRVVNRLNREITSKQQERLASSAACLVMVLTGAVMALRLRERSPLVVYLWSFFPALAAVLTVSAGQQATHDYGVLGLPVMWSGVVGLGIYTFIEFRRVARH